MPTEFVWETAEEMNQQLADRVRNIRERPEMESRRSTGRKDTKINLK